jgi:hypothetical protein
MYWKPTDDDVEKRTLTLELINEYELFSRWWKGFLETIRCNYEFSLNRERGGIFTNSQYRMLLSLVRYYRVLSAS